jgi:hypothetical protein
MLQAAGVKKILLHISVNIAGMCNKTDKLIRMYGQYSTYFGVRRKLKKIKKDIQFNGKDNEKDTFNYPDNSDNSCLWTRQVQLCTLQQTD